MSKVIPIIILLVANFCHAQTISGKVENLRQSKIMMANLMIKDVSDSSEIKEFVLVRDGNYSIILAGNYRDIIVEVRASGYYVQSIALKNIQKNKTYILDFVLQKDTTFVLDEVVVRPDAELPEPNDTTKYNVADLKNGNERKIQDIIARIPGISIDNKGEIKYKDKPIRTAMMDGDDLFGSRYKIGTKNINVDMIDQIQVIENYSDNPLTQGFDNNKNVALNLTFKKGKTDYSGSVDAGIGLGQGRKIMHNSAANMVVMSQAYKSFVLGSYNNIGQNSATDGYDFDYEYEFDQQTGKKLNPKAPKIINEFVMPSMLDEQRANLNQSLLGSYSGMLHLDKKTTLRTSLFYLTDNQRSIQNTQSENFIDNQIFRISDSYDAQRKPKQYKADFQIKRRASENIFIKYDGIISNEITNSFGNIVQNKNRNFSGKLRTQDFMIHQTAIYTYKISKTHVLMATANQSSNTVPQTFLLGNTTDTAGRPNFSQDRQQSSFGKNILDFEISWLGKAGYSDKFRFSMGANAASNKYNSDFMAYGQIANPETDNRVRSRQRSMYQKGQYALELYNFKIQPAYMISYLHQSLTNLSQIQKNNLLLEPSLTVSRKLSNITKIDFQSSYTQKSLLDQNFFANPVIISNRTSINNVPTLGLERTSAHTLKFSLSDNYNQFLMDVLAGYTQINGNFYNRIFFDPNATRIENFWMPLANENTNFGFSADKYLQPLKLRLAIKSSYSIMQYKNIINTNAFRNNTNHLISHQLRIRTNLETFLDFENKFSWTGNSSKTEANAANKNQTINNNFVAIVKLKKRWSAVIEADYFLPNTNQYRDGILFLDAWIKFQPKEKYEIKLVGKNLTNNQKFVQVSTSDFAITSFSTNLISRYVMLYFSYSI